MLKVVHASLAKLGQSFLDEIADWRRDVDWGDDEPQPGGRISPHGPQGVIDEGNFEQFEPDMAEPQVQEEIAPDPGTLEYDQGVAEQEDQVGIPRDINKIMYDGSADPRTGQNLDQQQQVYDGIDNDELISFDYTTRHGTYAGTRIVEPHYTFIAETTGNEVLVTFDQGKGAIRAFIVGNIHPYGVRYEGVKFEPRGEIMKGIY